MASLLAGLAAAEKIQTGVPSLHVPGAAPASVAASKSRRPSKSSKKGRKAATGAAASSTAPATLSAIAEGHTLSSAHYGSQDTATSAAPASAMTLDALGLSTADTGAAQKQAEARSSKFGSQLTLDALGLSLADMGAAMEADPEAGALTMQSLGLTSDDMEDALEGTPEDVAERMSRILETFGGSVGATADFVLVSEGMEPDVSYLQPVGMRDVISEQPRQMVTANYDRQGAAATRLDEAAAGRTVEYLNSQPASTQADVRAPEMAPAISIEARAEPRARQDAVFEFERHLDAPQEVAAIPEQTSSSALASSAAEARFNGRGSLDQGSGAVSLADLGLDIGDLAVGADGVDDDVLDIAKQLAAQDDSPRR